jgi:hypothetical protein
MREKKIFASAKFAGAKKTNNKQQRKSSVSRAVN